MKKITLVLLGIISLSSADLSAQSTDVPSALRATLESAHTAWKKDGGAEFKSGLTYVQGVPTLMVISTPAEPSDKKMRRKRSLVAACEFLLEDQAFSSAMICVVEADSRDPKKQTVSNVEVRRGNYQEAVKQAAKVSDLKEAGKKAKETDSVVETVCAELGIK
jgi:hypothetical protein